MPIPTHAVTSCLAHGRRPFCYRVHGNGHDRYIWFVQHRHSPGPVSASSMRPEPERSRNFVIMKYPQRIHVQPQQSLKRWAMEVVCKLIGNDPVHRDVTLFVERTYCPASSGPHRNKVRIHEPSAGPAMSDPVGKFKLGSSTFHIAMYLCGIDHVVITKFRVLVEYGILTPLISTVLGRLAVPEIAVFAHALKPTRSELGYDFLGSLACPCLQNLTFLARGGPTHSIQGSNVLRRRSVIFPPSSTKRVLRIPAHKLVMNGKPYIQTVCCSRIVPLA